MIERPRRLRQNPVLRSLVAETRLHPRDLVLPVFVGEGLTQPRPDREHAGRRPAHPRDASSRWPTAASRPVSAGSCSSASRSEKDATGSGAVDPDGILNVALRTVREAVGDDLVVMADTCLDEFTDHGHCGVLDEHGRVDNDATNLLYAEMAVAQARAGAHVVAPSGMMDGQVAVIREALDAEGLTDTVILAYSAKYASAFFGPFREAVQSSLQGDRRTYQQDPANIVESLREIDLDIAEGADMVMVKPAMSYLDVVAAAAERASVPVAAYQVSGEYSMIHAAAANGWIDLRAAAIESLTSIRRAGAQVVLTYFALDVTEWTA